MKTISVKAMKQSPHFAMAAFCALGMLCVEIAGISAFFPLAPEALAGSHLLKTDNAHPTVKHSNVPAVIVSFLPSAHGTLSAETAGELPLPVRNGDAVARGTTITFTALPDAGYQFSRWTGDCDGNACEVTATMNVSVGAVFADINECAAGTDGCAAIGGQCQNTPGAFLCHFNHACVSKGWPSVIQSLRGGEIRFLCQIPLKDIANNQEKTNCALAFYTSSGPPCSDAFGYPPVFPTQSGHQEGERYAYNCPAAEVQSDDLLSCVCPTGRIVENDGTCKNTCRDSGWALTVFADGGESCVIPVRNETEEQTWQFCNLAGTNGGAPGCSAVFGVSLRFPPAESRAQEGAYVYNCPNGQIPSSNGLSCVCPSGYMDIGRRCADIDECAADSNLCSSTTVCENTIGGFSCECPPGNLTRFVQDGECMIFDPGSNNDCTSQGWTITMMITANPILTCLIPLRDATTNEEADGCRVYDQWAEGHDPMEEENDDTACRSVFGGAKPPHIGDHKNGERFVHNCPPPQVQSSDFTSCVCPPGHAEDGGDCADIDECATGTNTCGDNAVCANTVGSFTCACADGHARTGLGQTPQCAEIDECAAETDNCADIGGVCANTVGAFTCSCKPGYSGDGIMCDADKTVSFSSSANGTLFAVSEGVTIQNGDAAAHGTTVTFTAEPDAGYQVSLWTGDCAGASGNSCEAAATLDITVGAAFADIDECAMETDNCAAVGAVCANTIGSFVCSCKPGYSGGGVVCNADKTVSFSPSANGTLVAASGGVSLRSGGTVTHGAAVTFTAEPDAGYQLSLWTDDCAGTPGNSCEAAATLDITVGAVFADIDECAAESDNCAAVGGFCANTPGAFTCGCAANYFGDGLTCEAGKTVSFSSSANGTLFAVSGGVTIQNGDAAARGTTVTFIAEPDKGYQLSLWTGDCAGASRNSCEAAATLDISAGAVFADIDECAAEADNCAAVGGVCANTPGAFICSCKPGYSGGGIMCEADKTVSFSSSANGTLFAVSGGVTIQNGDAAAHGTTITFTAKPDAGYQLPLWTGDCAGMSGISCEAAAKLDITVGAVFADIDECATEADNCAAVGGFCANTPGTFACSCESGFSGDGVACEADKTISLPPAANGTVFASYLDNSASTPVSVMSEDTVPHGTTIRFRAKPNPGFYVLKWTENCEDATDPNADAPPVSLEEKTCEVSANADLRAGAVFARAWRVFFVPHQSSVTLSARVKGGSDLKPLDAVPDGATIIYTASPRADVYISGWQPGFPGDCDAGFEITVKRAEPQECEAVARGEVFQNSAPTPIVAPLPCLHIAGAESADGGRCACETRGHLIFGETPKLFCAPPTICPEDGLIDGCVPQSFGLLLLPNSLTPPDAVNEPDACENLFGGLLRPAAGGQMVCSGVDRNNTFCIVGSQDAFPCRGLLTHVWQCNRASRPALNPFFCGAPCGAGDNVARGRYCGAKHITISTDK